MRATSSAVGQTVAIGFSNAVQTFPPLQTKQIEAGVKLDMGRMTAPLSGFEIARSNRGIEINVFGEVTPEVRLLGGLALIDGQETKTQSGIYDGKFAVGMPTFALTIRGENAYPAAAHAGGNVRSFGAPRTYLPPTTFNL